MRGNEIHHTGNEVSNRNRRRRIDHQSRHITKIILRTTTIPFQQPLKIAPRGRLMPSITTTITGTTPLKPPPPLSFILGLALNNHETSPSGRTHVEKTVEVGSTGERRVNDDAETEAELSGGHAKDDVVGEVVEEFGR